MNIYLNYKILRAKEQFARLRTLDVPTKFTDLVTQTYPELTISEIESVLNNLQELSKQKTLFDKAEDLTLLIVEFNLGAPLKNKIEFKSRERALACLLNRPTYLQESLIQKVCLYLCGSCQSISYERGAVVDGIKELEVKIERAFGQDTSSCALCYLINQL